MKALTYDVYNFTCLGLFETHKLMLSFQMTIKVGWCRLTLSNPC